MIGIYKIENLINGKVYIGQTNDINNSLESNLEKRVLEVLADWYNTVLNI